MGDDRRREGRGDVGAGSTIKDRLLSLVDDVRDGFCVFAFEGLLLEGLLLQGRFGRYCLKYLV